MNKIKIMPGQVWESNSLNGRFVNGIHATIDLVEDRLIKIKIGRIVYSYLTHRQFYNDFKFKPEKGEAEMKEETNKEIEIQAIWVRSKGIKSVIGDKVINTANNAPFEITKENIERFNTEENEYLFLTEFSWRENAGEQPVGDDIPVDIKIKGGGDVKCKANTLKWRITGMDGDAVKWKPNIEALHEMYLAEQEAKVKTCKLCESIKSNGSFELKSSCPVNICDGCREKLNTRPSSETVFKDDPDIDFNVTSVNFEVEQEEAKEKQNETHVTTDSLMESANKRAKNMACISDQYAKLYAFMSENDIGCNSDEPVFSAIVEMTNGKRHKKNTERIEKLNNFVSLNNIGLQGECSVDAVIRELKSKQISEFFNVEEEGNKAKGWVECEMKNHPEIEHSYIEDFINKNKLNLNGESAVDCIIRELSEKHDIDMLTDEEKAIEHMIHAHKKASDMNDVLSEIKKGYVKNVKWVGDNNE